jgi:hypothetical protein
VRYTSTVSPDEAFGRGLRALQLRRCIHIKIVFSIAESKRRAVKTEIASYILFEYGPPEIGENREKGSIALFSMLLKLKRYIELYMVIHKSQSFDYARVWRIFWTRAKRQWNETARDKECMNSETYPRGEARHYPHG